MRIGELADATGVSTRSLRYYEELDLIRSARTAGGWRDFDDTTVERVVTIQHLFAAGLCGVTIGQLLPCLEAAPDQRTGELEDRLADEIRRLEAKRRDLDRELEVLHTLRDDTAVRAT
jgi:DNA-binding transcriptional MerR regulator